jgi:hypothetical protein
MLTSLTSVNTHKRLRALGKSDSKEEDGTAGNECVICLMAIAVRHTSLIMKSLI